MEYIGIDVHKKTSQVCIRTEGGELVERKLTTAREAFAKVLGKRAGARIVLEASTESEWVARCLEELGHEVIVADPNLLPMYAHRSRKVKTDRRDARALCEACRLGAYRPAHRASDRSRHRRGLIAAREALVQTRTKYISVVRALLRRDGHRIRSGGAPTFVERVKELDLPRHLRIEIEPLLALMKSINVQLKKADRRLATIVKDDEVAQRLCTVPGVGPVTAVTLVSTLDRVERFDNAGQVRCYLGLVPREHSSGERQLRGRITKAGNSRLRSLLVEAAWSILRYDRDATRPLRDWALRIASRRGKRIAVVALARKLAGILYAMWRDGTTFGEPASRRRCELAA